MMMTHDNMIIVNAVNMAMMLLIIIDRATSALRWKRDGGSENVCTNEVMMINDNLIILNVMIIRCGRGGGETTESGGKSSQGG